MKVPLLDLKLQHQTLKKEILALWEEILDSSSFIGGRHVEAFEEDFARSCSVKYCISVSSGTDALRFIFAALGLKAGDEVITVPNTFIATTEAISQAGGKVVFVDIDPDTYNLDPKNLKAAITNKTKGIVPVHLYGQPADMDAILDIAGENDLWVVEDACQAHLAEYKGKKTGSLGVAAAFSFYPGKNMGACGEAGAVTTNDAEIAERVCMLRDHGQKEKYIHEFEGYNGRCDALQAAALRVKLRHLPRWNTYRREHAQRYIERLSHLKDVVLPKTLEKCLPAFHLFVIHVDQRDAVAKKLGRKNISTGLHYPLPLHLQTAYSYLKMNPGAFPIAEACAQRILSLPMYPELTEDQINFVCETLEEALKDNN
jgi:dTDP-4-amino-4,6-dideoxygalactose transaminase